MTATLRHRESRPTPLHARRASKQIVIVFGSLVADEAKYARCAGAGIDRVREDDSMVLRRTSAVSMAQGYNELLSEAGALPELEALVLLHEDAEIVDPEFCAKVRAALSDPAVGLVGVVGARGVTHLAYWRAELHGHLVETRGTIVGRTVSHDVDAVDGLLMVLAPQTVRRITFDETAFPAFHGYDVDFSFAVRAAGARVITADIAVHHHTKGGYGDVAAYLRASRAWRHKWLADAPLRVRLAGVAIDLRLAVSQLRQRLGFVRPADRMFKTERRGTPT